MVRAAVASLLSLAACAAQAQGGGSESGPDSPPVDQSGAGVGAGGEGDLTTSGSPSATTATTGTGGAGGQATGSGTGGEGQSGACLNSPDMLILNKGGVQQQVQACAQQHVGQEPATQDCIKQSTNLSDPCVGCFDDTVHCTIASCASECFAGPSQPCQACIDQHCMPAFDACSGV